MIGPETSGDGRAVVAECSRRVPYRKWYLVPAPPHIYGWVVLSEEEWQTYVRINPIHQSFMEYWLAGNRYVNAEFQLPHL
jgi:hypothetical protein